MTPYLLGACLRQRRRYATREEYANCRFQPFGQAVHTEFVSNVLYFESGAYMACSELQEVYEAWLESEFGHPSNNVDRNFLYEEIELRGNGIARWHRRPRHHFVGVGLSS